MNKKTLLKLFTIITMSIILVFSFNLVVNAVETKIKLEDFTEEDFNTLLKSDFPLDTNIQLEDGRNLFGDVLDEYYDEGINIFPLEIQDNLKKLGISIAYGNDGEVFLSEEFEKEIERIGEEIYEFFTNPIFSTAIIAFFTFIIIAVGINAIIALVRLIAKWKIHTKAGKPGWAVFIPVYRNVIMLEIAGLSPALLLLFYILIIPFFGLFLLPLISLILRIIVAVNVSKRFGKTGGFAIGLILLPTIFYAILGFSKSEYVVEEKDKKESKKEKKEDSKKTVVKEETKVIAAEVKPVEKEAEEVVKEIRETKTETVKEKTETKKSKEAKETNKDEK